MKLLLKFLISGFFMSILFANDAVFLPGDLSKTKYGFVDNTIVITTTSTVFRTAKNTSSKTMEKLKNALVKLYCSDEEFRKQINSGKDAVLIFEYSNGSVIIHINNCKVK